MVVVYVAGCRDDDRRPPVTGVVVVPDAFLRYRSDHLFSSDDWSAQGGVSEYGLGDQVVGDRIRVIPVHRDLFDHDLALGVDL